MYNIVEKKKQPAWCLFLDFGYSLWASGNTTKFEIKVSFFPKS